MSKNPICEMLGIKYPVFQGGMAWIADAELASAVSNAGGLGIIAAMNSNGEQLREQIRKAKKLTDKPFGVNLMLMSPYIEEAVDVVCEEKVQVVTTGAGNPARFMQKLKDSNVKVICVVASVALAVMVERMGASAVIAEGCESGGHVGDTTTMALVPQVVDAVNIPVIAAGGIADGRGMAASFMLGAKAIQMGTRFLTAKECNVHENYKEKNGQAYADQFAARPDFSEHQTGLALDIFTPGAGMTTFENTKAFKWLKENSYKYGFILRYPEGKEKLTGYSYEPWHYRYLGKDLAKKVYDSGLTFDEYYTYYLEK